MVNLSLNEEKVRKELSDFPNGIKAKYLMEKLKMSKTTLYECLNSLEMKGLAYHENRLWYPEKPSQDKQIVITTEESIPITEALDLMKKYPIVKIQQKKGLIQKLKELLNMKMEVP